MKNKTLYENLEHKLYWAEKRLAIAQKDVWTFKQALEKLPKSTRGITRTKKVEQLDLFAG